MLNLQVKQIQVPGADLTLARGEPFFTSNFQSEFIKSNKNQHYSQEMIGNRRSTSRLKDNIRLEEKSRICQVKTSEVHKTAVL